MDTDSDLASLPTTTRSGISDNEIYNLSCGKGSMAISLESGNVYVLNSSGNWILIPLSSGGGGGTPADLSGYVSYLVQEKTTEEKEIARTNIGAVSESKLTAIGQALLNCFEKVAWTDEHGQDYYDALNAILNDGVVIDSISATFNQGSAVIYEDESLEVLPPYLTVTAHYENGTTAVISDYTLEGTLTTGTSTITVESGNKTATFDVNVTALPTITVYVGKGISYDTTQVVTNAKRCISEKVPFNNSGTIKVQWKENTAYRWSLKNELPNGAMDSNGAEWTPDGTSERTQQDSSLSGWIFSDAEQSKAGQGSFTDSSGYCRILFAPLAGMTANLPSTLPSGYIIITGTKYKIVTEQ